MSGRTELDEALAELERTIARLADGSAPLEELVGAHQRAPDLLAEAQSRLAELKERAEQTANLLST